MNLYNINSELQTLLNNITETGELTEEQAAELESLNIALEDKHKGYGLFVLHLGSQEEVLDKEIKRLTEFKKAISNKKKIIKETLSNSMAKNGISKLEFTDLKLSFRKSSETDIYDEASLPDEYFVVKKMPDKTKIKKAIDSGIVVDGARLIDKQNLQIK